MYAQRIAELWPDDPGAQWDVMTALRMCDATEIQKIPLLKERTVGRIRAALFGTCTYELPHMFVSTSGIIDHQEMLRVLNTVIAPWHFYGHLDRAVWHLARLGPGKLHLVRGNDILANTLRNYGENMPKEAIQLIWNLLNTDKHLFGKMEPIW